ncbi:MAG TPA: pantoate--beta-alanine ligase [bacterium]|nr:pantoate--beta-alanine ligase [bacterium]
MKTIKSIGTMRKISLSHLRNGEKIGFVPTMGYLHDGHLSLLKKSKQENDITVLSIFVNPTQFAPNEDFDSYPRDFKRDEKLAASEGADYVFYPSIKKMYPDNFSTFVESETISRILEGEFRPSHFRGVLTIVAKLINIVMPDIMYLGQKDAQQAAILTKMAADLNFRTAIKVMPVIRDKNGLALSSRNARLTKNDYITALQLNKTLKLGKNIAEEIGDVNTKRLTLQLKKYITEFGDIKLDYIACRDCITFEEPVNIENKTYILIAARVGKVRLIDNMIVKPKK